MFKVTFNDLVIIAMEIHLFPCRTQKLSPSTAEVLGGCPLGDMRVAKFGSLAQLGEHLPYKQRVSGSSPLTSTNCGPVVQLVRTLACHARGRQFEPDSGRHLPL